MAQTGCVIPIPTSYNESWQTNWPQQLGLGDSLSTLLLWSRLDGGLGKLVRRLRAYPLLANKEGGGQGLRGGLGRVSGEPKLCKSRLWVYSALSLGPAVFKTYNTQCLTRDSAQFDVLLGCLVAV